MKRDLWGNEIPPIPPKEIAVNIYHDEREVANNWLYHSFLFIPALNEEGVMNLLNEARQKTGWLKELHFVDLRGTRTQNCLALEWIDLFAYSLKKSRVGEDKFHTQPIKEIELKSLLKGEDIAFEHSEIIGIDSDHRKERTYPSESHFVQFVDLIMGTFSQIFDNTSKTEGKCIAADKCLTFELPAKLVKYNANSRYYKRYAVSFFPKQGLTKEQILEDDIRSKVNQFYNKREMKYILRNQRSLF